MVNSAVHHMKMCHCILPTIVHGRRKSDISLVVLEPVSNGTICLLHLSAQHCHISSVIHYIVPVVLQDLFCFHILGIHHQSAGVSVKSVHHMSPAFLSALLEIIIQHRFHIQRRMPGSHREYAHLLFHHYEPSVFIHNLDKPVLELHLVALRTAHSHLHARCQRIVKLAHKLAVHFYSSALEGSLDLRVCPVYILQ